MTTTPRMAIMPKVIAIQNVFDPETLSSFLDTEIADILNRFAVGAPGHRIYVAVPATVWKGNEPALCQALQAARDKSSEILQFVPHIVQEALSPEAAEHYALHFFERESPLEKVATSTTPYIAGTDTGRCSASVENDSNIPKSE